MKTTSFLLRGRPTKEVSKASLKARIRAANDFMVLLESKVFAKLYNRSRFKYAKFDVATHGRYITIVAGTKLEKWYANRLILFSQIQHSFKREYEEDEQTFDDFIKWLKARKATRKAKRKAKRRPTRPKTRQITSEEAFFKKMFA